MSTGPTLTHLDAILEALDEMHAIAARDDGDFETNHLDADEVLVALLRSLGFNALADVWESVEKWYA